MGQTPGSRTRPARERSRGTPEASTPRLPSPSRESLVCLLLMRFDVAALMGYTGAVFQQFFGRPVGALCAGTALLAWVAVPFAAGLRSFRRKDF